MSKQLTVEQRYTIYVLLQQGCQQKDIANTISVHKSTVSREIRRNADGRSGNYSDNLAQRKTEQRRKTKRRRCDFTPEQKTIAKALLEKKLSPEQISGRCKLENIEMVSHETIYKWILADKKTGGELYKNLRRQGRKYRHRGAAKDKRGIIPNRVHISERAAIVDLKQRFGDLEIDTIIGKNHKGAILTINDRATGWLWIEKLTGKDANMLADKTIAALLPFKEHLKTITADNGKEFAMHEKIACQLGINFYFCTPYHSWERGANENANGLVRQYIPKKTDFETITAEYINFIRNQLNNRPRKKFGYKTPTEIMLNKNINQVAFRT